LFRAIQYSAAEVVRKTGASGLLDAPLAASAKAPARPWVRGRAEALA